MNKKITLKELDERLEILGDEIRDDMDLEHRVANLERNIVTLAKELGFDVDEYEDLIIEHRLVKVKK